MDRREGWKTLIVSKLIYECGALAWYQRECDDLEVLQSGFERWLWEVGKVRNELVRGESGCSSFAEREVKCIVEPFKNINTMYYNNVKDVIHTIDVSGFHVRLINLYKCLVFL